jgi:four helix bundle protein
MLSIARGSLCELETLFIASVKLKLLRRDVAMKVWDLCQQVGKMLRKLIASLND